MNATSASSRFNLKFFRKKYFTRRTLLIILLALSGLVLLDGLYLYSRVPDWSAYAQGSIPKSSFMRNYENVRVDHRDWPALRWRPIPLSAMPKHLRRAVIVAEDSRFYEHNGIDLIAFREAMKLNLKKGKIAYGASTISQQTVKNLFLSPSRDPLRKWHELVLTLMMERRLSKSRILKIYLNIAEFGRGIYGVEAAAQYYFGKSASALTVAEAAGLAASLPSPVKSNPATRSRYFVRHRDTILARVTPSTPASGAAEAELSVLEPEAAPTPAEEEPQVGALEQQQYILEATPPADSNTSSEVAQPLEAPTDAPSEVASPLEAPAATNTNDATNSSDVSSAPDAPNTTNAPHSTNTIDGN